jgi:hypothetical protein
MPKAEGDGEAMYLFAEGFEFRFGRSMFSTGLPHFVAFRGSRSAETNLPYLQARSLAPGEQVSADQRAELQGGVGGSVCRTGDWM